MDAQDTQVSSATPMPDASGPRRLALEKIVSGGQTGADRAALDWAIAHGLSHGGWCPQGRWAEDGPIPSCYQLKPTPSAEPEERTEWNVRDSDATVIFSLEPELSGGSLFTAQCAARYRKPCLHLSRKLNGVRAAWMLRTLLEVHGVRVLNVAGPRASREPGIGTFVRKVLEEALGPFVEARDRGPQGVSDPTDTAESTACSRENQADDASVGRK